VLRGRGCDVRLAGIELTDSRWSERFTRFPLRHAYLDIVGMMPAQVRGATGEIRIPEEAKGGDYDLVVIGSPTWWLKTSVPIRSGENRERYLGLKIPPTNLKPDYLEHAQAFATGLADALLHDGHVGSTLPRPANGQPRDTTEVSAHE
jgi:hypothetical protein